MAGTSCCLPLLLIILIVTSLYSILFCLADGEKRILNITIFKQDDFEYYIVPNVSVVDLSIFFKPKPGHPSGFTPWPAFFAPTIPTPSTQHVTMPNAMFTPVTSPATPATLPATPAATTTPVPLTSTLTTPIRTTTARVTMAWTPTTTNHTEETVTNTESSVIPPDSPIGYDVPCGIRGGSSNSDRIVGGCNAQPGEFPWQVSLQLMSGWSARHICGGAVLSSHWVVTAAHCVHALQPSALTVVAGDYDLYKPEGREQRVAVIRIIKHHYRRANFSNDIALLQVHPSFKLDGIWVAPICLPESTHNYNKGYATVTGWGRLAENGALPHILQQVSLPIIPKPRCRRLYRTAGYSKYLNLCQMCSGWEEGGIDSCQGDSGGPLACRQEDDRYYLCGVVSWGVGCARPRFPGVYTEVACYSQWIRDILYNSEGALTSSSDE